MARNHVIGRDNALPWRLPEDLRRFKSITMGKPVLMGRKTFESIGKPLPGRTNLVLTRDADWQAQGAVVVHSLSEALERSGTQARDRSGAEAGQRTGAAPELACIGGAEIFQLLLPLAGRIYLTRIDADIPGDTLFPPIDYSQWAQVEGQLFRADERNAYDMTFVTLERAQAAVR